MKHITASLVWGPARQTPDLKHAPLLRYIKNNNYSASPWHHHNLELISI